MPEGLVVHCKKSPFDVYIGRPSIWGNPYSHKPGILAQYRVENRDQAILKYEEYLRGRPDLIVLAKGVLRGKILGCWCSPLPCHGDVLIRIVYE
jgi:hypothetical protein